MSKTIVVFSGPSGAGKSTLIRHILSEFKDRIGLTVSCTTRPKREREIPGVDYWFISNEKFDEHINNNDFIEYVECYGNRYGTLKSAVQDVLNRCDICVLDLDYVGSYKVLSGKLLDYKTVGILVLPASLKKWKQRLIDRNSETEESLKIRITESFNIDKISYYDHILLNGSIDKAKQEISDIVMGMLD
ncbi:MAG: guanylate kinase [Alphaproteobacteria bacterium]|nr:guanylate kinase [Alphaproteobacteria bacterium]